MATIVIWTQVANLRATDWRVNSLGRNYSHSFGYGVMDASGMVKMAQLWRNVGPQVQSAVKASIGQVSVPGSSSRTAKMEVTDHGDVNFLEHVQAHVTVEAARRGDISIYLTSPAGTKSQLLARRPHDSSRAGFHDWPFLTVFCWGEHPAGTWQLEIQNEGRYAATLTAWSITFHGTTEDPDKVALPSLAQSSTAAPTPAPPPVKPQPTPAHTQPKPAPAASLPASPQFAESSPQQQQPPSQPPQPQAGASVAAVSLANCVHQVSAALCQECEVGFRILSGKCVKQCPGEGYYEVSQEHMTHILVFSSICNPACCSIL